MRVSSEVTVRAKVWLEIEGEYAFGLGISTILKAVDQEGSIKSAAKTVGKSYRYIWARIKEAEETLGISLVETHVGGNDRRRSELTSEAATLVRQFDRMRQRIIEMLEQESQAIVVTIRAAKGE